MGRGRLLGGCAWLLAGLALLQTLYLRALPPPRAPVAPPRPPRPPRGVLDVSGTFRVYRDVLGPPPVWATPELVLATHGSPGRAAAALGGSWGGPVAVAVFGVPREGLQELLALLGGPCRALRARLRLHVVLGAAEPPPGPPPRAGPPKGGGCRGALRRLAAADPPSYTLGVPYPGNLLRNVAWEGAAEGKGGPPKSGGGGRFVLLVDADVVPSRGLREGFLRLLGEGGLHPRRWGAGAAGTSGGLGDPKVLGAPGGLRVPNALEVPTRLGVPDVPGVPKDPKALEDPKGLSAPGVPNALGVPSTSSVPGFPNALKAPNTLEVPKGFDGLAVPNTLEVPNALEDPNIPKNPNSLEDPKSLKDPKGFHDLGVPNALDVPNTLKDPKDFHDPGVPNTLNIPNTLDVPNSLDVPSRVVFVLPAFEVRAGTRVPGSKEELLLSWGAGDARPFYGTLCPRCQAPTDFGRWRALPPSPGLRVAYEVPWRDPWEPFYVAPARGVPPFDERFLQYGFNRISQACELHVAGFRFAVLDGAFVAHQGFKEPGGFHGGREAELGHNRRLFRSFRAELAQRYPHSARRC